MTEDVLLSELCAICHLNSPKYKCPRCTIQTCSLDCVKRHKLWSQCSGARDPAAYKKRHQLATTSSFDQDFNFITHIERTLERAGLEAQERGIPLSEDRRKRVKGEARRDVETQQRTSIVLKAPPGMSRALQNKSKWDNRHKCLLWTVEWILEDGSKVYGNCQETRTITEAFANAVGKRMMRSQQKGVSKTWVSTQSLESESATENQNNSTLHSTSHPVSTSNTENHFYLHRPNLPSDVKAVIPLQPDAVIKDAICDRVLIEFPTIFVLRVSQENLQNPFITEEEYLKQNGSGSPTTMSEALQQRSTANENDQDLTGFESTLKLDGEKLAEALQNDLRT